MFRSTNFQDDAPAARVLFSLRKYGLSSAIRQLDIEISNNNSGLLLAELNFRLRGHSSPRLIIDTIWLKSQYGGISRVWFNLLNSLSLPGLVTDQSPVALISRSPNSAKFVGFDIFHGSSINPLDFASLDMASSENHTFASHWKADVFCSTWITRSSSASPYCPEMVLFHDCIPELFSSTCPSMLETRRRWILFAKSFLTVSLDSSLAIQSFYDVPASNIRWCHPSYFFDYLPLSTSVPSFTSLQQKLLLRLPFIVLPGSGSVGSYKNPELLARALCSPSLLHCQLLVTGVNARNVCNSILEHFPSLHGRVFAAGFTDSELSSVFRHATAVVIPSLVEGFGLPVLEVLASNGFPIISDVPGLREAGSECVLRFNPYDVDELISLLNLILDKSSRQMISQYLLPRKIRRLSRLNPDLFCLCFLAQVRSASDF
ncbi:Glycosyltransferase-like [Synechococcus sp. CC9902]|uniref:glycosyltransferase n=1 Tax=Synechococcus sp. (strain CC9902) TaxID=316279 RepID=UPI00005D3D13|nr:glycosyltransferase [Synechococcus sp. CC9902]ABB25097.1 Glycosyltransferase-like [Synechococcus sp. CC9902]